MSTLPLAPGIPRADAIVLSNAARAELGTNIRKALHEKGCAALVVLQPDHIAYLSGLVLPYPNQYSVLRAAAILSAEDSVQPAVILPPDWAELPAQQNLEVRVVGYNARSGLPPQGLLKVLAAEAAALGLEKRRIGLDMGLCPEACLETLFELLPAVEWIDFTGILTDLRSIKTAAEIEMLEEAVRQADRAVVSALNHSEGCVLDSTSYSLWEFTERVRVHVGEFGGSAAGHLTTLQGTDMQRYSRAPRSNFVPGNLVRTEATSQHRGYWADTARTLFIGQADQASRQAYQNNQTLKKIALNSLRAGTPSSEVFRVTQQAAQESGIDFWQAPGIGHGIGLAEREAPYLCAQDKTLLKPGMVIVLAVYTYGPRHELICSKDTYQVTETGAQLLSWYRNWDQLYCLNGNTARHG